MEKILLEIIRAGASAPSLANSQPWRFSFADATINIYLDKKRAESLGNSGNTITHTTFGAVVENMTVAARHFGFNTKLAFFPGDEQSGVTAHIELLDHAREDSRLFESIYKRNTNRLPFKKVPVPAHLSNSFIAAAESFKGAHLFWKEDKMTIRRLAALIKETESIMFEHPRLHSDLFKWIRWTKEDAIKKGDGLSIKSLEIGRLKEAGFKFLSSWKIMNLLNKCGASRLVSDYSYRLAKSSAAIGLIAMDKSTPEDYFNGGRLLERVWLMATSHGLSLHPICPVVVLPMVYFLFGGNVFSARHQNVLRSVYDEMTDIFPIQEGNALIILFRIGYSMPPTERSLRRPIQEVLLR